MRKIKFRAWDKIHKEMSTWPSLYDNPNLWEYILSHNEQFENWIGDIVLMQYTGLKDKNGTEIYDGDIYKNPNGRQGEVIYELEQGGWTCLGKPLLNVNGIMKGEVIGNIYENPELLEEKR